VNAAPIVGTTDTPADPLPQALVLTAIVISFGMTAVIMIMAIGGHLQAGHDRIDLDRARTRHDHLDHRPRRAPEARQKAAAPSPGGA
jgi:multisubunit Na+/H+ antiporter MnhC subunit